MISLSLLVLAASPSLSTTAELTKYERTGRYAEVEALCAAYPKAFPGKVKCETFGTTPQGRPMLMLVASADNTFTASDCAKKQRPVIFMQGGIHAGEIDGKDAGFEVLRSMLDGSRLVGVLSKLTLVFVPVFNVDGHERFGAYNRPNQTGPAEMGWRVTANNLNLNRDYIKADAPETRAMLTLLHAYEPVMYLDLHATDGAKFQHDVAINFEPWQTGHETLRSLGKAMRVALLKELTTLGHLPLDFYPSFIKDDQPKSGFEYAWAAPRFGTAYWAANNRFGFLVETHSWKPYAKRVRATVDVCQTVLRLASEDGARWLKAAKEADAADEKRAGTDVTLEYQSTKHPKELEFLGYAYSIENSEVSGKPWIRYDDTKPEVWTLPYFDELQPLLTLTAPKGGYLVPAEEAAWVAEKLKLHAIRYVTLKRPKLAAKVETVRLETQFSAKPTEGHQTVHTKGAWKEDTRDLAAGSLFVPAGQPHISLLMHVFEPASTDSLLSWGFFNAHLEQKEYMEDYMMEQIAREQLKDPKVKSAFELKLKDPAFAADPDARLRFFYARHPSFDQHFNLYPIFRTAEVDFK